MDELIVKKLSQDEIRQRGIESWPIWEKEVSRFPWQYDGDEECLILEGEVIVETGQGNFTIKAGDFVIFKKGLKCVWDIKVPIRKHYNFL
ncbi:MAG TPA: DUF861 domain-containing protein [Bacteroidales bacterium]|nr:DUF861 domain-containing protein [Bacteroidales bacterium]